MSTIKGNRDNRRSKWREELKVVIESLREGRKSQLQLARKLENIEEDDKVSEALRKRVFRYLNQLEKWGLASKDNNLWCWYTQVRAFRNWGEYQVWLRHSELLLEALQALVGSFSRALVVGSEIVTPPEDLKLENCAEEHLRTGYPETHKLLCELRGKDEEIHTMKKKFLDKLLKELRNSFGELIDRATGPTKENYIGDNVPEAIFTALNARYKGYPSPSLRIDGGSVYYGDRIIGRKEKLLEPLKKFIETKQRKKSNIKAIKENIGLELERSELYSKLVASIGDLVQMVRHGTPLEGECKACPSVRIMIQARKRKAPSNKPKCRVQ